MFAKVLQVFVVLLCVSALVGCEGDTGPVGAAGAAGADGGTGPPGPPGPSFILGFAAISAENPANTTVFSSGGAATTSVTVSRSGVGVYNVTFTGNYPGVSTFANVTALATILDTDNNNVAAISGDQSTANATTIVVRVFVWSTTMTPNPPEDRDFALLVMQ